MDQIISETKMSELNLNILTNYIRKLFNVIIAKVNFYKFIPFLNKFINFFVFRSIFYKDYYILLFINVKKN